MYFLGVSLEPVWVRQGCEDLHQAWGADFLNGAVVVLGSVFTCIAALSYSACRCANCKPPHGACAITLNECNSECILGASQYVATLSGVQSLEH